jgi:2-polyprenyl-3-methyl-5-hydroxy-6-metoxy-1,4-benzoquinol methylase
LKKVNRWFARAVLSDRLGYPSSGIADRLVGRVLSRVGVVRDMMEASALWQPAGKGKLLDVGCGSGEFLRWMRDLGWDVYGVEPDPAGAEVARGGNIPVRVGTVQQADFPADEFDLVTLSHVLEHLPDPIATITECRRILKPGGRLVAVTPNTGSRASRRYRRHWMGCEVPRHLMLFNTDSIREVAARASIKVVAVRTCARTARWIFRVSNCLTRMPHLPGAVCPHEPWLLPPAMLFQLGEHGALARDAGEELVLVAER